VETVIKAAAKVHTVWSMSRIGLIGPCQIITEFINQSLLETDVRPVYVSGVGKRLCPLLQFSSFFLASVFKIENIAQSGLHTFLKILETYFDCQYM
jgi:hypothetical protein